MKKNKKNSYAAYYRVSTKMQGKSGLGLQAQKTSVRNYLKHYWPPDQEFTEIESGGKSKRPELAKALEFCKKHKATLIVAKLDRLSRDLHFITSLGKAKVKFLCCDMPDATPLTINIMGSLAQWERERISKRTKEALAEAKNSGKKLGFSNPKVRKGLKKHWAKLKKVKEKKKRRQQRLKLKNKKELKELRPPTLTEKHDLTMVNPLKVLISEGYSLQKISDKLNKQKITMRNGKAYTKSSVVSLIKRLKKRKLL